MRWSSLTLAALVGLPAAAWGAIADFRVNEVLPEVGGDPQIRFVELFVPQGTGGNCLFPTTRIEVFDANGELLGAVSPFATTVCYEAGTYFLLATPEAAAHFGVDRDARLDVAIPAAAGQVCLTSSQTRYDCARWGAIAQAVPFLRNYDDATAAPSIVGGQALARVADTGVVANDFVLAEPTPRQPNDGSVWIPPHGGLPPDAPPPPDAAPADAPVFTRPDAAPVVPPDASLLDPAFLSADPGGGAMCSCRVGGRGRVGRAWIWALVAVAWVYLDRARRMRDPSNHHGGRRKDGGGDVPQARDGLGPTAGAAGEGGRPVARPHVERLGPHGT